ncbi:Serine/threonine-protein kinase RIO3 [Anabarilius grahami]|uniref:Serine/threonine-protein kinase RIO3 n=1 Tax=Anabarilius grahami TaxID=495550 RepID=A0A3N0XGD8_ANAGA|nr:Serine/threonine-protein kinase RIO3 [Anabarilius grahami]
MDQLEVSTKETKSPWGAPALAPSQCSLADVMSEQLARQLDEEGNTFPDCPDTDLKLTCTSEADTSSDLILAQMLQMEFDREFDTQLRREEKKFNGDSKVSISFENYRMVHPYEDSDSSEDEVDWQDTRHDPYKAEPVRFILVLRSTIELPQEPVRFILVLRNTFELPQEPTRFISMLRNTFELPQEPVRFILVLRSTFELPQEPVRFILVLRNTFELPHEPVRFIQSYIYGLFVPLFGEDSREQTGKHWAERGAGSAKDPKMGIELGSA